MPAATNIILLCSTGRAGTTITMRVLGLHPKILTRYLFPYEARAYQCHFIHRLLGHSSLEPVQHAKAIYQPFQENDGLSWQWLKTNTDPHGISVSAYYEYISKLENKLDYAYVTEKTIGPYLAINILEEIPASRVIFLVRDPRDVFCSIKAFNQKTGAFGFCNDISTEYLLKRLMNFLDVSCWIRRQFPDRTCLIRYEDISSQPAAVFTDVFRWLNIAADPETVDQLVASAFIEDEHTARHKTSDHDQDSVGRWRRDADVAVKTLFETHRLHLEELGYYGGGST